MGVGAAPVGAFVAYIGGSTDAAAESRVRLLRQPSVSFPRPIRTTSSPEGSVVIQRKMPDGSERAREVVQDVDGYRLAGDGVNVQQ
jgi:hypothetical protein